MTEAGGGNEPSEAELRAAWEEQLRRLTPADVIVQAVVSLISLAGRRLGVEPGTEGERDLEQVRDAIDGARGLLPVLERREDAASLRSLRDAISALQLEYVRATGGEGGAPGAGGGGEGGGPGPGGGGGGGPQPPPQAPPAPESTEEGAPGPAQRSGRLWVPGQ
ncbi:MAG TPA: hypothetical protein VGG41_06175 [Solirubrobacteraceae bacterium]|jgi:hypothetical protein